MKAVFVVLASVAAANASFEEANECSDVSVYDQFLPHYLVQSKLKKFMRLQCVNFIFFPQFDDFWFTQSAEN